MTDRQKAIERVRKLRALAGDGAAFEGERDACRRREESIMAKYDLTDADIDGRPPAARMGEVFGNSFFVSTPGVHYMGNAAVANGQAEFTFVGGNIRIVFR